MKSRSHIWKLLLTTAALTSCDANVDGYSKADPDTPPDDVAAALAALPNASVVEWNEDHLPTYIVGEMAKLGAMQTDDVNASQAMLAPALPKIFAPFRLTANDMHLRSMHVDDQGDRHFRYDQTFNGLPVIGGELVVHVDVKGAIYGVNGPARGDIPATLGSGGVSQAAAMSRIAGDSRFAGMTTSAVNQVYIQTDDGKLHKAYETVVTGMHGKDPARDKVYVDMDNGEIVADYPQIYFAESRKVYTAGGGTSLPGTLKRSEGQAATS